MREKINVAWVLHKCQDPSEMSDDQQGILIVLTVRRCRVLKALTKEDWTCQECLNDDDGVATDYIYL